ncbi:cartilage matrix protein-like [Pocillopora verrucosa]|uniref:cartilage matrix protein-like n=1 Tax=Pocillopora verrucosa TaxID=203993 RepID=UPI002796E951|nr:integrin alpha-E-like [Pocillopora verrucosa]
MKMHLFFFVIFVLVTHCAQGKIEKCDRKIDLAVVLDVSGSINDENISLAKKFAKTLLRRFRISRDNVRVSFVAYSESVKIYSTFEDDQEEEGLEQKVNNMFFEGSSTKTRKALSVLNNQLFVQKHGSRIEESDVRKVAVILTDGFSFIGPEVVKIGADALKKRRIEVFAIGITQRIGKEELTNLSSKPVENHFFRLNNDKSLNHIIDHIVKNICK